jgi:BMFP domain-containing protein YqiC
MEVLILNTKYDLEYYKRKYNKYQDLILEVQRQRFEQSKTILSLLDENEALRSKIAELENKRAYTIKLQTSKQ